MHAPKLWERTLILALVIISLASLTGLAVQRRNVQTQAAATRRALLARLMPEMQKCVNVGRRMSYAGADIRGELFSELRQLMPTVTQLNLAVGDVCGCLPIDAGLIKRLNDTLSLLDAAYRRSENAAQLEAALIKKLAALETILASRFTADGDLSGMT